MSIRFSFRPMRLDRGAYPGPTKALSGPLPALSAAAFLLLAIPVQACVICMPYPKETSADIVIKADTVVFARENPVRPLSYLPVETLNGIYDDDIPLLLDTTTARALQSDPTLAVVLVRDRPGGAWRSLGRAGSEYRSVLREVADWDALSKSFSDRARFFAPYLQHQDRGLADLAFLEVARAPYATIRELKATVERDELYRVIDDFFHTEWHGLYILMLGMSDRADDMAFVRGKLDVAAKFGLTINLSAYATAFIEMAGVGAVEQLTRQYFLGRDRSVAELVEIVKAFSTQGNGGRPELRPAIVDAYVHLLGERPELAGYVANDLYDWKVTGFESRMRAILDADVGLDEASQLAVAVYLSGVEGERSRDQERQR